MRQKSLLMIFVFLVLTASGFASSIKRITLSELNSKADFIVMAKVMKVIEKGNNDLVTIEVDSYLKGENPETVFTFTLVTRGGLKDFDPALIKGDTGVFFLKLKEQDNLIEKAYWGSIAIFPKNHFELSEVRDFSKYLNLWRTHRIKNKQIMNIKDYERGFQKGFTTKPGLVDGSPDFNLGHSDGMLAKMDKLPK